MEYYGSEKENNKNLRFADLKSSLERGLYNDVNAIYMLRTAINMPFTDNLA